MFSYIQHYKTNKTQYIVFSFLFQFFLKKGLQFPEVCGIIMKPSRETANKKELVLITAGVHPFPSRTRKLSPFVPTILGW